VAKKLGKHMNKTILSTEASLWKSLYPIGGISALIQLAAILTYSVVIAVVGTPPASMEGYFAAFQSAPLTTIFRGDFLLLFLIGGYFGTFPALFLSLRKVGPAAAMFATLFTFVAVTVCFATESTFALRHLAGQYAIADETRRIQLLAAGEAVIASDMWHSSGAYVSGFLMQGGGVIISLVMLKSKDFSKVTAVAGLLGNAFDLIQHLLHPFAPSIAAPIQMLMGPFYLVWFPMLARDFFRLAKKG
jgi:hypothetical protein